MQPTLAHTHIFQYLTRAEEAVIIRLRIGWTKATMAMGPPTDWHHFGPTLTADYMLLECVILQESRDEYYTTDILKTFLETILWSGHKRALQEKALGLHFFGLLFWCMVWKRQIVLTSSTIFYWIRSVSVPMKQPRRIWINGLYKFSRAGCRRTMNSGTRITGQLRQPTTSLHTWPVTWDIKGCLCLFKHHSPKHTPDW